MAIDSASLGFIPGLAKLPEKRKITQTEKRQQDCVYDRSKRNRWYIKEWEEYAWLAYDNEKNAMFCSSTSCCGGGQDEDTASRIGIRGNNGFATDESRTSKVSGGLVNFLVY